MSKEKALQTRKRWLNNKTKYCIVDTETTGLGKADKVVEIAIIDLDGNILLNTLVNPNKKIHWAAEKVHGISNSMVQTAPDIIEVGSKVNDILKNRIMIAYNAKFDARMIKQSFNLNVKYECLMHNVMDYMSTSRYISLEVATTNIRSDYQEHRALEDCYLCLKLIKSSPGLEEEVS
ncbi:MAG: 3'-5' exonuclease [Nanoarchaeota archaeon]